MDSSSAYVRMDTGKKFSGDGLWYYQGNKFTGYVRRYSGDTLWVVTNGKGGTKLTGQMDSSSAYVRMDTGKKFSGDGKYYKNGKVYTGVVGSYYYKKGVKQTSLRGWQTLDSKGNTSTKSSANTYYFTSSGKVYTNCWKNLKRNGTTYRFYFNSDGTLCKNLYKKSSAWKKKASKLVISRATHTATLYASYNGSYKIPTKSFVISTSKKDSNFKVGTYKLTSRQTWFTISGVRWWYKWATYISGSGSWCHSEQYYTKGNSKSLYVNSYNNLGTNQSLRCIRMQVVNAKLIYDMKGYGSIKTVVLNKSSNAGPFGKMTITDNVDASGKLSGTKSYDPTDPMYT
ncbi:MAG: L,D-transpeptidase, partial [Clostridiales bacterium]|nr:L,D-transpeptidase [Clostridiales bacterium]